MDQNTLPPASVLLIDVLHGGKAVLYRDPQRIITCTDLAEVEPCLSDIEAARRSGCHVAGFLAYEAGYAFEEKLRARWTGTGDPLVWFGVFDHAQALDLSHVRTLLRQTARAQTGAETPSKVSVTGFDMNVQDYGAAFAEVRNHLAQGDIYQVNLTIRAALKVEGAPEALLLDLLRRQPVAHAAYVNTGERTLLSLSPELFLQRTGQTIRTRPMKGTAPRGRFNAEDETLSLELAADPKQRAENTMIVDLMRNDLSRISRPGTVKVRNLCQVERYRTVHQMTSTVEAELEPGIEFPSIIRKLFPCGSITGAPKLSAMMIADRLETSPRGIYTGSIGAVAPNGDFRFNVAIRTLDLKSDGSGVAGTGSGVVFDSGAGPEYEECALKLSFLTRCLPEISLIETLAFYPGEGYTLLDRHLQRLADSARYFSFHFDEKAVRSVLEDDCATSGTPQRVRLELDPDGAISLSKVPLDPSRARPAWNVCIADETVSSNDPFLFHKTTHRAFYDEARARYAAQTGCEEVLFMNENGFLTEGSYTNLFVRKQSRLLTPALGHGLLPGVLRAGLLEMRAAFEADLTPDDLMTAEAVYVGNSVRGLIPVKLISNRPMRAVS
ncbi:aminodeoxychorismate synthase, component I [Roseibium aquae]|uniref:Aminodeoxychorismate synthase, component I n=1 Tax=Roseibium aquae TaxID=1323746 RepID=A0A916TM87_9HYPH|nr:aminodeoxychorismate synthase component I [Roseibium aquae]GGB57906.1 aminodeoxychorismate synthase, component I [Roseibium aquae]